MFKKKEIPCYLCGLETHSTKTPNLCYNCQRIKQFINLNGLVKVLNFINEEEKSWMQPPK